MEVKIIIDGVLHELVQTSECSCEGCSLSELCDKGYGNSFCLHPLNLIFVKRGKVKIEKDEST